jgi:uncharacterized protein YutE (UPF0331/DUF86 family)
MTPPTFDTDVVARRLRLLREALDQLTALKDADVAKLTAEPLTRAAAERLIQVVVDLAIGVNSHIAVAALKEAPASGAASFELAARAGAIADELGKRLAPAAGLRNVLVHRYVDIDVQRVADAIGVVVDGFGDYVRQVAAFTRDQAEPA